MIKEDVIHRGDSRNLVVTVRDEPGNIIDLTGATIVWEIADSVAGPALLSKTNGAGVTITDAAGGVFTVALTPADTLSLTRGVKYHEARMTDAGGDRGRVVVDDITIEDTLIG